MLAFRRQSSVKVIRYWYCTSLQAFHQLLKPVKWALVVWKPKCRQITCQILSIDVEFLNIVFLDTTGQ